MTSKQELREQITRLSETATVWWLRTIEVIRERDEARAELDATRKQRDAAVDAQHVDRAELVELCARVAELEAAATTPEPRPFRVGDRVRVAEGATYKVGAQTQQSHASGRCGEVTDVADDGDLRVEPEGEPWDYASPEFCTLIEDEPDDDTEQATADQAAEPRTLTITVPAGVAIEWSLR